MEISEAKKQVQSWNRCGLKTVYNLLSKKENKTEDEKTLLSQIYKELERRDNAAYTKKVIDQGL